MNRLSRLVLSASFAVSTTLLTAGCGGPEVLDTLVGQTDAPFSSAEATLLDFQFDGELVTTGSWGLDRTVEDQLLYTIGHLNANNSVGRLDAVELTNLKSESLGDGTSRVTYHAKLPVGWGSKTNLPTSYTFTLPKRIDYQGLTSFSSKYKEKCVDAGAHEVDSGSMWYYYRPKRSGCVLDPADVVTFTAAATVSPENTTGKYPEYHMVWADQRLDAVAIFGKYEDGATANSDAGIAAYNRFLASVRTALGNGVSTMPASIPSNPGVALPDAQFTRTFPDGRTVTITALLVDNVRTAGASFDARYNELSVTADMIFYNGHAGLGSNVRALVNKGEFVSGKYQVFFMNGCDTFAYVDGALAQKKASINADDPNGSKYLDMVTNAMPSFFSSMSGASMALIKALLANDQPKSWEQIFAGIDDNEVVVVTGEEDNVFHPGWNDEQPWAGMDESSSVNKGEMKIFPTAELPAGAYVFTLAPAAGAASGTDADLYVRAGSAPTASLYDCRPYKSGSAEQCSVTITSAAKIFVGVSGYSTAPSAFRLTGRAAGGGNGGGTAWTGMTETTSVAQNAELRRETPVLAAGTYRFTIAHDANHAGGDADLYVKVGTAPTTAAYDCRPYENGSAEVCSVIVTTPSVVHLLVRGYAAGDNWFVLTGTAQ